MFGLNNPLGPYKRTQKDNTSIWKLVFQIKEADNSLEHTVKNLYRSHVVLYILERVAQFL